MSGSYHGDESNDKITVSSVNGGQLQAGELAQVEAQAWAWSSGSSDTADFYHAADATLGNNVVWEHIGSVGAGGSGLRTLNMPLTEGTGFILSGNPNQAVRVRFRYTGSQAPCNNGSYDDADDLVFAVAPAAAGNGPDGTASYTAPIAASVPDATPITSDVCQDITREDRCDAATVCYWKIDKQACMPIN